MPRVPDEILESVFYLYPSHIAAEKGEQAGGCGFFMTYPFEHEKRNHLYAVTNRHVIADGNWTFRVNRGSKVLIVDTDERQWFYHPDEDDLAIHLVDWPQGFSCTTMGGPNCLAVPDLIKHHAIGVGDDVYTVGRFVNHDGKLKNNPVVRFGNIAQMPLEPIQQRDGHFQESYLVECRSVSGYSGSPVLVEIPPWSRRPGQTGISSKREGPFLLGVNWGHLNDWKPVCDSRGRPIANPPMRVGLNSGMMGVVPAWKLTEMLAHEEVMAKRKKLEETILGSSPPISSSDSAVKVIEAEPETGNPDHKEDFTRLLNAAARKQSQDGQT